MKIPKGKKLNTSHFYHHHYYYQYQTPQEMWELSSTVDPANRRYTVHPHASMNPGTEDLHAWSIYRQNLNSDFTDSALGSEERSPLPYGNFQLREQTVQSILRHPRLAPRSELANNMYAYLKFGLPRVFPPGGPTGTANKSFKDTASDIHALESVSTRNTNGMNGVMRARSETDLVNGSGVSGGHHGVGHHPMGLISNRFRKPGSSNLNKAISESNLLNGGGLGDRDNVRGLVLGDHLQRPMSKAGSQASLVSRNSRHHANNGNVNRGYVEDGDDNNFYEFPHLQVRNMGYDTPNSKSRVLDGISFDLHGGESLAILATNGYDATTMLDILAGRKRGHGKVYGEFTLNGNPVTIDRLGSRIGYVRKDYRLHKSISVEQTLSFHYLLRSKDLSTKYLDTKISVLLEELGLGAVRKSLVSTLTSSERQRLVVACQLITGAEIMCLDDATHGMDIFDTFFLVEYLKNWALSDSGRIVMMTIHPPTYEIFSMFTKVALISTGRLMFYGHRREMLPYFAFIEYPCPAFKNPSDYYLDLVTLDNLSSEALLESSQRIETLADSYRRKQEMIQDPIGPPQPLPPRIKNAGFVRQFYALLMNWIGYKFPWNLVDWMLMLMMTTSVSILIGALYWDIRWTDKSQNDQKNASDRLGFHWVLSCLMIPPVMILLSSTRDTKDLDCVTRDFEERLYSKAVFFMAKNLVELPYMLTIYLGYIIPAYLMAGLAIQDDNATGNFYAFIGYMLLYMHTLRIVLQGLTYLLKNANAAITIFIILFFITSMSANYTVHPRDLGEWVDWVKYISPLSWTYQRIVTDELSSVPHLICQSNPVLQDNNILTQLECNLNSGNNTIKYHGFTSGPPIVNILSVCAVGFVFYLVGFFSFLLRRQGEAIPPVERP